MRLVIISNMAHYQKNGTIVGHGATVRELNQLATLFDEVRHIGCWHEGEAPPSFLPYTAPNLELVPVPPSGGRSFRGKLRGIRLIPHYAKIILQELKHADAVHVRAPANIPFLGILLLALRRHPTRRWFKFAGSWQVTDYTSTLSKVQRWWLNRGLTSGIVTVNGAWEAQPPHVLSFHNPCLTQADIEQGRIATERKQADVITRLLYVGNLTQQKGVGRIVEIMRQLREQNYAVRLDVVGGGVEDGRLLEAIQQFRLEDCIQLHGELQREDINAFYAEAQLILLPSDTEGFPKVLSEAMAFGVVPIASETGSIAHYLHEAQTGKTIPADDIDAYVEAVVHYVKNPQAWHRESQNSVQRATQFTYDNYLQAVRQVLRL